MFPTILPSQAGTHASKRGQGTKAKEDGAQGEALVFLEGAQGSMQLNMSAEITGQMQYYEAHSLAVVGNACTLLLVMLSTYVVTKAVDVARILLVKPREAKRSAQQVDAPGYFCPWHKGEPSVFDRSVVVTLGILTFRSKNRATA